MASDCRETPLRRSAAPEMLSGPDTDLRARGEGQLVENVLDVGGCGAPGDEHAFADLTIAQALRDQRGDLAFAGSEQRGRAGRLTRAWCHWSRSTRREPNRLWRGQCVPELDQRRDRRPAE